MNEEKLNKLYTKSIEIIDNCQKDINNGALVNLDEFEKAVKDFCGDLSSMPVTEALKHQPKLQNISEKLETLADSITGKRNEIMLQIKNLNKQKKATHAYKPPKN